MYARRLGCKNKRWNSFTQPHKHCATSNNTEFSHLKVSENQHCRGSLVRSFLSQRYLCLTSSHHSRHVTAGCCLSWKHASLRSYSSKGDESIPSEDKHVPVKNGANVHKGKTPRDRTSDAHARLGEQDQKEWLKNEKLSMESKKKDSPFLCKRERFKNEFLRRVVPWENITVSWDTFPYHIHEHTKNVLVECAASNLKHTKVNVSYGARLISSSGRILLQSSPGTELYRERLVRALAKDLQVPLLVLESNVLAPYDFGEECASESESEDENAESGAECTSESEVDDDNNATNEEEWASGSEVKSDSEDDAKASVEALRRLVPYSLEDFAKNVSGELEGTSVSREPGTVQSPEKSKRPLKKGDRVKYVGPSVRVEADNRSLPSGQRGEVFEVNGDRVAVVLDSKDPKTKGKEVDEKIKDEAAVTSSIYWINIQDIEHDPDTEAEDWYLAMEALFEILPSLEPIIVYFPDTSQWLSRAVPKSKRRDFVNKVEEMLNRLSGPVVVICGQNKVEAGSKEKEKFTMVLPNLGRLAKLPLTLKSLTEGLKPTKRSQDNELYKLFTNVICIHPPKDEELLRTFNKQVEEDRRIVISRSNLNELHKEQGLSSNIGGSQFNPSQNPSCHDSKQRIFPALNHGLSYHTLSPVAY